MECQSAEQNALLLEQMQQLWFNPQHHYNQHYATNPVSFFSATTGQHCVTHHVESTPPPPPSTHRRSTPNPPLPPVPTSSPLPPKGPTPPLATLGNNMQFHNTQCLFSTIRMAGHGPTSTSPPPTSHPFLAPCHPLSPTGLLHLPPVPIT